MPDACDTTSMPPLPPPPGATLPLGATPPGCGAVPDPAEPDHTFADMRANAVLVSSRFGATSRDTLVDALQRIHLSAAHRDATPSWRARLEAAASFWYWCDAEWDACASHGSPALVARARDWETHSRRLWDAFESLPPSPARDAEFDALWWC